MFSFSILASCTGINLTRYKDKNPPFVLEEYFSKPVSAWGIVQDRSGNVIRRFEIKMHGKWQGHEGEIREDFEFYDGEKQTRVWKVKKLGPYRYEGRAEDIEGHGRGVISGNAMRWKYSLRLPVDGKIYSVDFDDWMWQMKKGVVINRSYMKKFGFNVGEVTVFLKRDE